MIHVQECSLRGDPWQEGFNQKVIQIEEGCVHPERVSPAKEIIESLVHVVYRRDKWQKPLRIGNLSPGEFRQLW